MNIYIITDFWILFEDHFIMFCTLKITSYSISSLISYSGNPNQFNTFMFCQARIFFMHKLSGFTKVTVWKTGTPLCKAGTILHISHVNRLSTISQTRYGTYYLILQQPFNGRLSPGRPVPEETFTRSHPSLATYFLYHLSPLAMVHGILFIQLTCLTVLSNNLFPGPLWSSPWSWTLNFILHAFLHPIIHIFSQHMPIPTQPVLLQYQCYVIYT